MSIFYHVARTKPLFPGQVISLTRFTDIQPGELQSHLDQLFPDGVTNHGDIYFLNSKGDPRSVSPNIEILYEYVRRAFFPKCPSRFQSVFAFTSQDAAIQFRSTFGHPSHDIWEISAEDSFNADMNLLTQGNSILCYSYFAHLYWQGRPSANPFWEVLLFPPVQIVRRIC